MNIDFGIGYNRTYQIGHLLSNTYYNTTHCFRILNLLIYLNFESELASGFHLPTSNAVRLMVVSSPTPQPTYYIPIAAPAPINLIISYLFSHHLFRLLQSHRPTITKLIIPTERFVQGLNIMPNRVNDTKFDNSNKTYNIIKYEKKYRTHDV